MEGRLVDMVLSYRTCTMFNYIHFPLSHSNLTALIYSFFFLISDSYLV